MALSVSAMVACSCGQPPAIRPALTTQPVTKPATVPTTAPAAPVFHDGSASPLSISAQVGVPFSVTIMPVIPRSAPYSTGIAYTATNLPAGLTVNDGTGVIQGTPTQAGSFEIPISAANPIGTANATLKILVYPEHPSTATTIMHLKGTTQSPFGYVEFLPKHYYLRPEEQFPVVVDLCGAGNVAHKDSDPWGDNTQNKLWDLTAQALRSNQTGKTIFDDADCIVLSPIPPQWWEDVPLDKFFDFVNTHYRVDRTRVYLTGLSAGGDGVLDYVKAHGDRIAGCVFGAISHDNPGKGYDWRPFLQVPTWIYENWEDPFDGGKGDPQKRHSIVFSNHLAALYTNAMTPTDMLANFPGADFVKTEPKQDYTALFTPGVGWTWKPGVDGEQGPPLRLTQFKTRGHGGWQQTYDSPDVWRWLFAQRRLSAATLPATNRGLWSATASDNKK